MLEQELAGHTPSVCSAWPLLVLMLHAALLALTRGRCCHRALCCGRNLALRACRCSQEKKKKWEPPAPPPRVGKKQRKRDAAAGLGSKLPPIAPNAKCKLRLLKLERVKDYLLMEHEFVQNQEQLKPQDERNEEDRTKVSTVTAKGAS